VPTLFSALRESLSGSIDAKSVKSQMSQHPKKDSRDYSPVAETPLSKRPHDSERIQRKDAPARPKMQQLVTKVEQSEAETTGTKQ